MLDLGEIVLRIAGAAAIGGVIGLNRNLNHKYIGLRTLALIGAAAAGTVLVILDGQDGLAHVDALSRVIQGLLTGVGFIGAGVIVHGKGEERVRGLTTAASVWTVSVIGILCGAGVWRVVGVVAAVSAVILIVGGPIERRVNAIVDGLYGPDKPKE
ncbi:MAG: MgtC/SapB family protein [Hyphomicrobiaceae bacterium]|nr:MgtC/SapB family protein [Hyphomicrobiaceae bacterium]